MKVSTSRTSTHSSCSAPRRVLCCSSSRSVAVGDFLHDQRIELDEVYRDSSPSGWTSLKRSAGLLSSAPTGDESVLSRRFRDLLHVDDPEQLRVIRRVAESGATYAPSGAEEALR